MKEMKMNQVVNRPIQSEELKQKMNMWRAGFAPLPQEYIDLYETTALASLPQFAAFRGWEVHRSYLADDGWGDGMKFICAICEDSKGNLFKIKYSDQGTWFRDTGHGWSLI